MPSLNKLLYGMAMPRAKWCRKIPEGYFTNTIAVWCKACFVYGPEKGDVREEWAPFLRITRTGDGVEMVPAPSLAEMYNESDTDKPFEEWIQPYLGYGRIKDIADAVLQDWLSKHGGKECRQTITG